jgi:hypothetical protein
MNAPLFLASLIAFSSVVSAAEVIDSPGPGYRQQAAQLKTPSTKISGASLHTQPLDFCFAPVLKSPLMAPRPAEVAPQANPFDKPVQLFGPNLKADSQTIQSGKK